MPVFSERDKEKIHWMLYDSNPGNEQELVEGEDNDGSLRRVMGNGNVLQFFQDVNRKTKLETNMDASGMLSRNTFEVRALRVVIAPMQGEEGVPVGGGGDANAEDDDDMGLSPRVIEEFIYNSVTTLTVGEKKYVEAPTFNFPSGGGSTQSASHGEPNPMGTFRFAEPVLIPPQQNFRVEIAFPHGLDEGELASLYPAWVKVWVVLDGYLIRDVQ